MSIESKTALEKIQRASGHRMSAACIDGGWHGTTRRTLECGRCILQLRLRLVRTHLAQGQHRVPERKLPPSMLAVAHRSQVRRAAPQSLFGATKPAGEQVPPQADAALATTIKTRI